MSRQRDQTRGNLIDSDLEQVSLRDKIFQVCSMLYEQQKKAGLNLAQLEARVTGLRKEFTAAILRKNHWETPDSIDQLFARSEGLEIHR